MIYYIYEVTFLKTGKTYVGQRQCPKNKTPETDTYMGSGKVIRDYYKKHHNYSGWIKVILQVCNSKEEIDKLEVEWIAKRKAEGKAEYNFALGGNGNPMAYYTKEEAKVIYKKGRAKTTEKMKNWSKEKRQEVKLKKQKAWKDKHDKEDYYLYTMKQSKSHKGLKYNGSYRSALSKEELEERDNRVRQTWAAKTKEEIELMIAKRRETEANWDDEKRKHIYKSYGHPGKSNPNYGNHWWNNGIKNLAIPDGQVGPPGYVKGFLTKKSKKRKYIWITNGTETVKIHTDKKIPEGWWKGRTKKC